MGLPDKCHKILSGRTGQDRSVPDFDSTDNQPPASYLVPPSSVPGYDYYAPRDLAYPLRAFCSSSRDS
ncbi:hypothetical protein RRG08_057683 [Elysia crispata]|uniref:Uncharacterized protein n=1 Tax=Elysia crispata TaxID=231223 RepID=A0AAE1AE92_9GAST|nr:hypothetical protein RRG08_057683 [Elysia crispata]